MGCLHIITRIEEPRGRAANWCVVADLVLSKGIRSAPSFSFIRTPQSRLSGYCASVVSCLNSPTPCLFLLLVVLYARRLLVTVCSTGDSDLVLYGLRKSNDLNNISQPRQVDGHGEHWTFLLRTNISLSCAWNVFKLFRRPANLVLGRSLVLSRTLACSCS